MTLVLALALLAPAAGHAASRISIGDASPRSNGTKGWEPESWMGDLFSRGTILPRANGRPAPAPSVTLGRLAIPGSHDSAAYATYDWADECGEHGFFKKLFGTKTARRWARTQHYNLRTQANLGVRSFDIRPYYNGRELRTCHGLDTGPLLEMFEGDTGLNTFVEAHPKEVLIINLSHFRPEDSSEPWKYAKGIDAMVSFLSDRVCGRAIDPHQVPKGKPGWVSLEQMWKAEKNYVVLADDENGFYDTLVQNGLGNCVFNTNPNVSGGYAGERGSVEYGPGRRASTNLWKGMIDDACYVYDKLGLCRYGDNGREYVDGVRDATEKVLLDQFMRRHDSLDEVSYIWVYGTFAGVTNESVILNLTEYDDATLITATEDRRWKLTGTWPFGDTVINGGLLPYSARFIKRLNSASKSSECFASGGPCYTTVNIVNMDAIGKTALTRQGFIDPLMELNQSFIQ